MQNGGQVLCELLSHLWQHLESKISAIYLTVSREVKIPMIHMPFHYEETSLMWPDLFTHRGLMIRDDMLLCFLRGAYHLSITPCEKKCLATRD